MGEVSDFFLNLFDTSRWPPRWRCGYWSDFHGWLYILSDLTIWISYFLIPLIILNYLNKKKAELKFNRAYVYFAAFILLCGTTHFIDAVMFWAPMYRLNALVRLATALVSMATVYHLVKILPEVFRQRTSKELEKEIYRREQVEYKLAEANKNLEAFAHIASHDLQEPLRKISTNMSLLLDRNIESLDDRSLELGKKITDSSRRLQQMVQDILSLSSIRDEMEFTEIDLNDAVNNALDDLDVVIQQKQAVISVSPLPMVRGNLNQLSQLFMNLVGNAMKFSTRRPVINISAEESENMVTIRISDNGIGMKKEDTAKIFEAFYRLHSYSEYQGSGLGLAIVKKIVNLHGGNIRVESEPGEGTEFIISLPKLQRQIRLSPRD